MSEQESLPPMSSMDCWDYTIELECLQGNQGTDYNHLQIPELLNYDYLTVARSINNFL